MMDTSIEVQNNDGITHLGNGKYANAIDSFTNSLGILKRSIIAGSSILVKVTQDESLPSGYSRQIVPCHIHRLLADGRLSDSIIPNGLYLAPFRLSGYFERSDGHLFPDAEGPLAIIFNIALAHHLSAIYGDGVGGRRVFLSKACALYSVAYNGAIQEGASSLLTLASLNNLGHTYRALGNHLMADQCFRHLLSALLFLGSNGGTNFWEEFLESVWYLIPNEHGAPAA